MWVRHRVWDNAGAAQGQNSGGGHDNAAVCGFLYFQLLLRAFGARLPLFGTTDGGCAVPGPCSRRPARALVGRGHPGPHDGSRDSANHLRDIGCGAGDPGGAVTSDAGDAGKRTGAAVGGKVRGGRGA